MLKFTASVREWMSVDPKNIIAIHCKGGKGDAEDHDLFRSHFVNKDVGLVYMSHFPTALLHRSHRYSGVHLVYWQWPVWECKSTSLFLVLTFGKGRVIESATFFFQFPFWCFISFVSTRTVWSILVRGGRTRVRAPSFREWRRPLRLEMHAIEAFI